MSALFTEAKTGWRELLGSALGLACGVGMYTPITSMFFHALGAEFHWPRAAIAGSLVALPLTAIILPFAGRLIDRHGVRWVAGVSAALMAASFLFLSFMNGTLAAFYAGFIAFNVLGAATGPISYTRPVARSFLASRGMAIAIALSGISVSGIVLAPVLGPILAHGDWRTGYRILALVSVLGAAGAILLIRPGQAHHTAQPAEGLTRAEALRTGAFWRLGVALFAVSAASVGFVSQLQSVALDFGVPMGRTAILLAGVAFAVLVFRLLAGWFLDALRPEWVAAGFLILSGLGLGVWLVSPGSFGLALAGSVVLGLSVGAEHAFMSFFCARLFGLRAYSAIFGLLAAFLYVGMAAGGVYFAWIHDQTGSYTIAIVTAGVLMIVSGLLMLRLPPQLKPRLATA
jgi:MFS family permease